MFIEASSFWHFPKSEHFLSSLFPFFFIRRLMTAMRSSVCWLGRVEIEIFRKFSLFRGYIFKLKPISESLDAFSDMSSENPSIRQDFRRRFSASPAAPEKFSSPEGGKGCRHAPFAMFSLFCMTFRLPQALQARPSYVGLLKLLYLKLNHINPALSFGKIRRHGS